MCCGARDRRDEAVARPRHRFDVRGRPCIVAKRLAKSRDVNSEDPLFNERLRPDIRQEFSFRHQMARLPNQRGEDVQGFRRQMDDAATAEQLALAHVEREIGEVEGLPAGHQTSANLSRTFRTNSPPNLYGELYEKGLPWQPDAG
jgi:hypothetical protein